jgi:hypothetical protein
MPSPFPEMDPYLEGYLWPDVHQALAAKIRQQLVPRLRPRYVTRLALAVLSDEPDEAEIKIMYPGIEALRARRTEQSTVRTRTSGGVSTPALAAPLVLPRIEMRLTHVEVREVASNELVTVIEILSPINKREPNLSKYRDKITDFYQTDVHVLEIDLLRRGARIHTDARLRAAAYVVTLTRAMESKLEAWPLHLADRLPIVPVPLRPPDADVPLDLSSALNEIYDEAAYDLSIDYRLPPPPPPLSPPDTEWLRAIVESMR